MGKPDDHAEYKLDETGEICIRGGCVMLGSLIHNANVVARLEQLGARQVDSTDEVHPGDTVIIRSHGEGKEVYDRLVAMGCPVADSQPV